MTVRYTIVGLRYDLTDKIMKLTWRREVGKRKWRKKKNIHLKMQENNTKELTNIHNTDERMVTRREKRCSKRIGK